MHRPGKSPGYAEVARRRFPTSAATAAASAVDADDLHRSDARVDRFAGLRPDDGPAIARRDLVVAWFEGEFDFFMDRTSRPNNDGARNTALEDSPANQTRFALVGTSTHTTSWFLP